MAPARVRGSARARARPLPTLVASKSRWRVCGGGPRGLYEVMDLERSTFESVAHGRFGGDALSRILGATWRPHGACMGFYTYDVERGSAASRRNANCSVRLARDVDMAGTVES